MKYRQLVKTVDTSDYHEGIISLGQVKAQYNPERFHLWKSLHKENRKDKSYRQLQRLYGRNNRWIDDKIKKFLDVFESIKNEGFKESIMIVERSLVTNKYNDGFEIFEGHHRVGCALVLNMKEIPCQIIRRKNEND